MSPYASRKWWIISRQTGRYWILRKLESPPVVRSLRPEFPHKGIILDTETTGLNHRKEEIIGLIAFTFGDDGSIGDVIGIMAVCSSPANRSHERLRS
jgi:DNA polymerase-3 subunit epsilon